MKKYLLVAAAAALLAGCATGYQTASTTAAPPLAMKGGMLVNDKGLTVYTFDKDVANSGKSACVGDCAVKWPPVTADAGAQPQGPYTIIVRDDGKRQWAYRGKPVYTWPEDDEPGDKYGDNKFNVWHIVTQ